MAPSIRKVAPGSMVIEPVPLTTPSISSSPPVEAAGTLLLDASIVPELRTEAAIVPKPTKVPVLITISPDCGMWVALPGPEVNVQSMGFSRSIVPPIHVQVEPDIIIPLVVAKLHYHES